MSKTAWFRTMILAAALAGAPSSRAETNPVRWTHQTGKTVYATPFVSDGVVYIGSLDGVFYALDAASGALRWRHDSGRAIYATAALDSGVLCFKSGNDLVGLDLSGNPLWRAALSDGPAFDAHDEWDNFQSSPVVLGGVAYTGSEAGALTGVRLRTGEVVFRCWTPDAASTVETAPAFSGGLVVFGDWDGVVWAFDLATAGLRWKYDTRDDGTFAWANAIQTDPVIRDGRVYFGGRSCRLYCLDLETGARLWSYSDPGSMWLNGGPTLSGTSLFLGSSDQRIVHCFDPENGAVRWKQAVDQRVYGKPLPDPESGALFFGTGQEYTQTLGSLYAADPATGALINRLPVYGQVHSSPVLSGGVLYFGCGDGRVYAVDRDAFLARPLPSTGFADRAALDLGAVAPSDAGIDTTVTVINSGAGPDSVFFSSSRLAGAPDALTVEPAAAEIPAGGSAVFRLRVRTLGLAPKKYSAVLTAASRHNLEKRSASKALKFTLQAPAGAGTEAGGPTAFSLGPNFPNPFNPVTRMRIGLPEAADVRLDVLDPLGRAVRTLVSGRLPAGSRTVVWDGLDGKGEAAAAGLYVARLSAARDGRVSTAARRMLLLR